jgi:hypothetical protein
LTLFKKIITVYSENYTKPINTFFKAGRTYIYHWVLKVNKNVNRRCPREEPCGTPDNTEREEGNFPKVRTNEDMFDK